MTNIPDDLRYTKDDEWIRVEGDTFETDEAFGVVESVKAAADLLMPVSGTVTDVNEDLIDTPELVNEDPYGEAWMIRIELSDPGQLDDLMDAAAYEDYLTERE